MSELEPLLVSVREARRLLGGISNNKFWKLAKDGEVEVLGTERKRWITVASLKAYVDRMLAAARSERQPEQSAAMRP